jgi:hypothetical protein
MCPVPQFLFASGVDFPMVSEKSMGMNDVPLELILASLYRGHERQYARLATLMVY